MPKGVLASPLSRQPVPLALHGLPPTRHPTKRKKPYSIFYYGVRIEPTLTPDISLKPLVNSQQRQARHAYLHEAERGIVGQRLIARRLILGESEAKASLSTLLEHAVSLVCKFLEKRECLLGVLHARHAIPLDIPRACLATVPS